MDGLIRMSLILFFIMIRKKLIASFPRAEMFFLNILSIDFSELMLRTFPKVIQSTSNVTLLSIISDYIESASKRNLM